MSPSRRNRMQHLPGGLNTSTQMKTDILMTRTEFILEIPIPNSRWDLTLALITGASISRTFFYGSFGNEVLNNWTYTLDIFPSNLFLTPKSKTALYNSWTPDRQDAKAPIIENDQNFSNGGVINSYRMEKGSYLRNKTMILGYRFPVKWLQKLRIENLRAYIQAANLFTITNYTGFDPELSGKSTAFGIDHNGNYPNNQKQFLVGFNLGF